MKKRVLASLCGCYVMISCGSLTWGVPTYTSEFVDGTQEYDFNDFVFSIPKSWSECYVDGYSSDEWKTFSMVSDEQEYGVAAFIYNCGANELTNFLYSDEELALLDGNEGNAFSFYPILNNSEKCYFNVKDVQGDDVYTFAFPFNNVDYIVFFEVFADCPVDFTMDIANIMASIEYANSEYANSNDADNDLELKYNELLDKYNELLGIKSSSDDESMENVEDSELPDGEILFRNIPWKTDFATVQTLVPEFNLWALSGEGFKTYSVDDIIYGDYEGIDFQESGFNVIGNVYNNEQEVAGYTTSDISMYFVYPVIDGNIEYDDAKALLYGARYEFEPKNVDLMLDDFREKLSAIYGQPIQDYDIQSVIYENEHLVVWETKTCKLSVHSYKGDSSNKLDINYALKEADVLLQQNNDIIYNQKVIQQSEQYGNGNTNGL